MQPQRTKIDPQRAESLLFPIAAFLLAGGMSKRAAQQCFSLAYDAAETGGVRRIDHIGHPTRYADVVAHWTHDSRFVDGRGRPRLLALKGKHEFDALVRAASPTSSPRAVLAVLVRYGNVRRTKGSKYELVRPFFFASTSRALAFEPMAYFLSDASSTLGRILKRTKNSRRPELFWRKVESTGISEALAKKFTTFARERSLGFLEELDDWLEARCGDRDKNARGKFRRVGLGLFSIHSDLEGNERA